MFFDSFLLDVRFSGATTFSCNWFRSERGAFWMNAIDAILYRPTVEETFSSLSIFHLYLSILLFVLPVCLFCLFTCPAVLLPPFAAPIIASFSFMSYYHNYFGRECLSSHCCLFSCGLYFPWHFVLYGIACTAFCRFCCFRFCCFLLFCDHRFFVHVLLSQLLWS